MGAFAGKVHKVRKATICSKGAVLSLPNNCGESQIETRRFLLSDLTACLDDLQQWHQRGHVRAVLLTCEGFAQGHEEAAAFTTGGVFHRRGPGGPCVVVKRAFWQEFHGLGDELFVLVVNLRFRAIGVEVPPFAQIVERGDVVAGYVPEALGQLSGHTNRRNGVCHLSERFFLQHFGGERVEVFDVEFGRRCAKFCDVKAVRDLFEVGAQFHWVGAAQACHQAQERHRLHAGFTQVTQGQGAEAFGERFALWTGQQGVVREVWHCTA
mmetsp:Transcript_5400/g.8545  ORF Transcript_5400/g.8545 Transcript_5400/m.8545 type:complete len:267 (+) Transcript_5400:1730-2530(+)